MMIQAKKSSLLFLVLITTLLPVAAQQPSTKLEDPEWIKEIAPKRIVYSVPLMNRVKVRKNLTYKRVGGAELKMDIYSPPASRRSGPRPAVIFIHGGRIPPNLLTTPKDWGPPTVTDEMLREFSPVYHLSKAIQGVPPIFIARAGLDDAELNAGVDRFLQVALSRNVTLDLVNHSNGHHGFDVEDDNDRSREIIKRTIEFIKLHS